MNNHWMRRTLLAVSIQLAIGGVYAAETSEKVTDTTEAAQNVGQVVDESDATVDAANVIAAEPVAVEAASQPAVEVDKDATPSLVPPAGSQAASALQQKEGDATQETNLQEVFTSNERQYSLIKKGEFSAFYDLDYSYYRDQQINAAMNDGDLYQLRVDEDASHTITNTFTAQYGVLDNLTFSASLPFVAKSDNIKDTTAAGLGDINLGARWEPFPLKAGRLPLILFGNVSTKTGDSPYEINPTTDLSTGKGYYSVGVGASTRKYIDPVVLFASVSANYGFRVSDLNQRRGSRVVEEFEPGISGGFAFGFAYSFNYDVSMTMSYQQSFNSGAEFKYSSGETYSSADQTSSTFAISLGVRVSPETIVNGTLGLGLTEDAPDISLGLSFPLDILGFGKKIR